MYFRMSVLLCIFLFYFFFFKQKTAYEMRISDWSSDVCSSDLHTWPDSLDVMGWRIEEDGFGVLFSRDIPALVRRDLRPAVERFLGAHDLTARAVDHFIFHPGGAKVLDALEDAFDLARGDLGPARAVLRDYGNMSAATVMFVLQRTLADGAIGRAHV